MGRGREGIMDTNVVVLVMVDECGEELEIDRFVIPDELDEDALIIWKSMKINSARKRFAEARDFYFEDRRSWNAMINSMIHGW